MEQQVWIFAVFSEQPGCTAALCAEVKVRKRLDLTVLQLYRRSFIAQMEVDAFFLKKLDQIFC